MTGWPRLSDNFCPKMRAMMSLPPPAAKPTMMWMGRVGYFAESPWAKAAFATKANHPRLTMISKRRSEMVIDLTSEPRDMDMQHRGLAVLKRGERAIDRGREFVRLAHAFSMATECLRHLGKIPPFALTARGQP